MWQHLGVCTIPVLEKNSEVRVVGVKRCKVEEWRWRNKENLVRAEAVSKRLIGDVCVEKQMSQGQGRLKLFCGTWAPKLECNKPEEEKMKLSFYGQSLMTFIGYVIATITVNWILGQTFIIEGLDCPESEKLNS